MRTGRRWKRRTISSGVECRAVGVVEILRFFFSLPAHPTRPQFHFDGLLLFLFLSLSQWPTVFLFLHLPPSSFIPSPERERERECTEFSPFGYLVLLGFLSFADSFRPVHVIFVFLERNCQFGLFTFVSLFFTEFSILQGVMDVNLF